MLEYKTDTRSAEAETITAKDAEELLQQRRQYYHDLVAQVLGKEEPEGFGNPRDELAGLSLKEVFGAYAAMRTSREIDHMMGLLQRTGNLWFSIAGAGKEAINTAISFHMRPDDAKLPYYRDQAMALWCGIALIDYHAPERGLALRPAVGRAADVQPLRLGRVQLPHRLHDDRLAVLSRRRVTPTLSN